MYKTPGLLRRLHFVEKILPVWPKTIKFNRLRREVSKFRRLILICTA